MHLKVHTAIIMNQKISDIHLYDKVRVACWDLDEKAAVQVVCEIEEHGGSGLPIKVINTSIYVCIYVHIIIAVEASDDTFEIE